MASLLVSMAGVQVKASRRRKMEADYEKGMLESDRLVPAADGKLSLASAC